MQIAKTNMIESQLKPEGINCAKTIDCISQINREDFIPEKYMNLSYSEYDVPLYGNYSMLRPVMIGKILQSLKIKKTDRVLEVGTGSGYLTCCLSMMGHSVDTVDINKNMIQRAKKIHSSYKIHNINYLNKDIYSNWIPEKNYDAIIITGSIVSRIKKLENLLNLDGKMFVVIGKNPVMTANIISRVSTDKVICRQLFETLIEPLENINERKDLIF